MTNDERWVDAYLDQYCLPGEHNFRDAGAGLRWCVHCYKEEQTDNTNCVICDSPATHKAEVMAPGWAQPAEAWVCGPCFEGLRRPQHRRLWRAREGHQLRHRQSGSVPGAAGDDG
jgi:hypothetical protein